MSQTILVTGGAGFIGSNLVRLLLRERPAWRVVVLDALTYSGTRTSLADVEHEARFEFVHGDVRDAACVGALVERCDAVLHLAAESHVDRSIVDAQPFVTTNVVGTQVVLDAALRRAERGGRCRVVYASTDEVYGSLPLDRPELKFTEETALAPSSPYAASKAGGDLLCRAAHHTHGLDVVVTRCGNNFGPNQFPEKVIPLFVTNAMEGKRLPLYGDGLNVRDWIHVEDHCRALVAVLERGAAGGAYNIGASNERSNIELARGVLGVMGLDESMIEPVRDRPGHDRRYAVDATKLRRELGWEPTRSRWPAALEETVRWYQANRGWWEPLKRRAAGAGAGTGAGG